MRRISQESGPSFHGLQDAAFPFGTQFDGKIGFICHVPHQRFGLMNIEIVNDKVPFGYLRRTFNAALDVLYKIFFGPCASTRHRGNLASGYVKVDDKSQGPMPDVFKLTPLYFTWLCN